MPALHDTILHKMPQQVAALGKWIDAAVEHADQKGFNPESFLDFRLAPDMFPFKQQVQAVCDIAKFAAARTAGQEAPKFEDDEESLEDLKGRIGKTLAYLETFSPEDIGPPDREVRLPFMKGKGLTAENYLVDFVVPNFYFHLTTAYALLRTAGVALGKKDYLVDLRLYDL